MIKEVHYSEYHSAPFAPCGARIISPDSSHVQPNTDTVNRVTCSLCQKWVRQTATQFNRARWLHTITEDYGT